jgi:hypothetical protein
MDLPRLLTDFQERFGNNLDKCSQLLDVDYENWHYFKQVIFTVAEKLGNPNLESQELYSKCMNILMHHQFKSRFWDSETFVLVLNYVDPELTKIFFYIINAVISHHYFRPYCLYVRRNFQMKLGYTRIPWDDLEYIGFELYDALVEINAYFLKFIPIYRPMPFFQSRLPLCDFDVAEFRKSSLSQRQKMLAISGISRLLVRRLFCFTESELHSKTKTILLRNF